MKVVTCVNISYNAVIGFQTGSCAAGEEAQTQDRCDPCPYGTYKESSGTELCTSCGAGRSTDEAGSTSASACKGTSALCSISDE